MRDNRIAVFLHLIWATWDRQPLIAPSMERGIYREIGREAQKMNCRIVSINGMADHIHLLVAFPSTISIADFVKQVKGVSSHLINETFKPTTHFKWQGAYGAYSVSPSELETVVEYVKYQKKHHREDTLRVDLEMVFCD